MSNNTIQSYTLALTIDPVNDVFLMYQNASSSYRSINRNTILGVTGTPADISSTQTFTNKTIGNTNTITIKDGSFTIQNTSDTTKQAVFSLSGITTATVRTYTLPNNSSTLVDLITSQTLTNKTLTAPIITGGSIDNTTITVDTIAGHTSSTSGSIYGIPITTSLIPGTNIAPGTITTTQIGSSTIQASNVNFGGAGSGIWWQEVGRTTLAVAGNTITISSIATFKYLKVIAGTMATGGTIISTLRFNNDSGTNYANRYSDNGSADTATTGDSAVVFRSGVVVTGGTSIVETGEIINVTTFEKLSEYNAVGTATGTGSGNAPERLEGGFKWANTSAQITRVDLINGGTGNYAIGSELIVLGHN